MNKPEHQNNDAKNPEVKPVYRAASELVIPEKKQEKPTIVHEILDDRDVVEYLMSDDKSKKKPAGFEEKMKRFVAGMNDYLKNPTTESEIKKESHEGLKRSYRLLVQTGKRMLMSYLLWTELSERQEKIETHPEEKANWKSRFLDQKVDSKEYVGYAQNALLYLEKTKPNGLNVVIEVMLPFNCNLIKKMLKTIETVEDRMQIVLGITPTEIEDYLRKKSTQKSKPNNTNN